MGNLLCVRAPEPCLPRPSGDGGRVWRPSRPGRPLLREAPGGSPGADVCRGAADSPPPGPWLLEFGTCRSGERPCNAPVDAPADAPNGAPRMALAAPILG